MQEYHYDYDHPCYNHNTKKIETSKWKWVERMCWAYRQGRNLNKSEAEQRYYKSLGDKIYASLKDETVIELIPIWVTIKNN